MMSKWIEIAKHGLPEETGDWMLVRHEGYTSMAALFDDEWESYAGFSYNKRDTEVIANVTHYHPLPEPPAAPLSLEAVEGGKDA